MKVASRPTHWVSKLIGLPINCSRRKSVRFGDDLVAVDDDGQRVFVPRDDEERRRAVERMVAQRELRPQRVIIGAQSSRGRFQFREPPRLPIAGLRLNSLPVCPLARAHGCVLAIKTRRPQPCGVADRVTVMRTCGSLSAVIDPSAENLSPILSFAALYCRNREIPVDPGRKM